MNIGPKPPSGVSVFRNSTLPVAKSAFSVALKPSSAFPWGPATPIARPGGGVGSGAGATTGGVRGGAGGGGRGTAASAAAGRLKAALRTAFAVFMCFVGVVGCLLGNFPVSKRSHVKGMFQPMA